MNLKKLLSSLAYLCVFVALYLGMNAWRSPTPPQHIALSYVDGRGNTSDLAKISHERPVLLYFWGSWCGVCTLTSPNVQALHDEGYPIISVAVSSGTDANLSAYMRQREYDFATINDTDGALFGTWGGQVTPSFVIIRDGKVHQRFMGVSPLWLLKIRLWLAH